jgi:hypothetical protein
MMSAVLLRVIVLDVALLNVIKLSGDIQSIDLLNVLIASVIVQSVIMLNVMAPRSIFNKSEKCIFGFCVQVIRKRYKYIYIFFSH